MTRDSIPAVGRWTTATALCVSVLLGCGGEVGDAGVTVRDSAGMRIVENPDIDRAPTCRLTAEPELDLGTADGRVEYEFHRVSDVARLPDGRIAVVNRGSREVRLYAGDGSFIRSLGGDGEGPGEFRAPVRLWQRGDSLAVYDAELQRFSWFSAAGELLRQVPLRPPRAGTNRAFLLGDGRILASVVDFRVPETGFRPQPLHLVLHDPNGQAVDTAGEYVWRRLGPVGPDGASYVTGPVFEPRTYLDAAGSRIFVGTGVGREVEVLRPGGGLVRIVRWSGGDRSVSDESLELWRSRQLSGAGTGTDSAAIRKRIGERPVAERFPALDRVLVGRGGRLWVRRYQRPEWTSTERWLVFGRDGELACRIQLPERFTPREVADDYLLGTWRDELDVVHVRVYGLEGAGGSD